MESSGAIRQQLDLLLSAYGYNLYNASNRARADDLLVRERASQLLGQAATRLKGIAADYSHRFVPLPSREQPFPPAERMEAVREFSRLQDEIGSLASRIRGMSVPTQDRVWARFRQEQTTLEHLLHFDYSLIRGASEVADLLEPLTAADWSEDQVTKLRSLLRDLEQISQERGRFLAAA